VKTANTVAKITSKYKYVKYFKNSLQYQYQFIFEFSFNEGIDTMYIEKYLSKSNFKILEEELIISPIKDIKNYQDINNLINNNPKLNPIFSILLPNINYENFNNDDLIFTNISLFYYDNEDKWEIVKIK